MLRLKEVWVKRGILLTPCVRAGTNIFGNPGECTSSSRPWRAFAHASRICSGTPDEGHGYWAELFGLPTFMMGFGQRGKEAKLQSCPRHSM
jgi:hypothetical protein